MKTPLRPFRFASFATGLVLANMGLIMMLLPTAKPASAQSQRSRMKFTMPRLSHDRGAPSKRGDGASRNQFCQAATGPIVLTPQYSEAILSSDGTPRLDQEGKPLQRYFALTQTSEARPSFALHMPLTQADVAWLELNLVVFDAEGNEVYDLPIPAPSQPGIITFKPDDNQAALEVGQRYDWAIEVQVDCAESDLEGPKYETLAGQIERHDLSSGLPQGQATTPMELEEFAVTAADRGDWPDAMAAVAELHRQDRSNEQYIADWVGLLESIGLEQLTTAPLSDATQLLTPSNQAEAGSGAGQSLPRSSSRLLPVR